MITGHVFIATSLDVFIARRDGSLDWLLTAAPLGEDHGYDAFMARMDGLIMGRKTYETVRGFDEWLYMKPVIVMSQTLHNTEVPDGLRGRVQITDEEPKLLFTRLQEAGWRNAYVDGGAVIRSFLRAGLISHITLTRVPVVIGDGLPLFGASGLDLRLSHQATRWFPSGLVQSQYSVTHAEPPDQDKRQDLSLDLAT